MRSDNKVESNLILISGLNCSQLPAEKAGSSRSIMLHRQANVSLPSHTHHTVATAALCAAASPQQMVAHSPSTRTLKLSSGSSISVDSAMRGENQFRGRSEAPNCKSGKKEKGSFLFLFLSLSTPTALIKGMVLRALIFFSLSFSLQ